MKRRRVAPNDLFGEVPAAASSGADSTRAAFSVSELAGALKELAEGALGQVWVKGELTGFKAYETGHWYFTLRDEGAQLRCVMWRTYAERLRVPPPEGTEVYLLGTPTVWAPRGELRLSAVTVLPTSGVGVQQLAFERTRELLERDGLFDPARKRSLPTFPRGLAVVTSSDGAVIHDIVTVARRRWPATRVVIVPARVQGGDAIDTLVEALEMVDRLTDIDLCIVARGGGAKDDLLAFNAEAVCRALARVRVPTISAIGHETDITLVDLIADVRAPTPSAAAELALPDRAQVARHVASLANRLAVGLRRRIDWQTERVDRIADRARHAMTGRLQRQSHRFERLATALDALNPLAVLARGYSVAQTGEGRVVTSRSQLPPGTPFTLRVADGAIQARSE